MNKQQKNVTLTLELQSIQAAICMPSAPAVVACQVEKVVDLALTLVLKCKSDPCICALTASCIIIEDSTSRVHKIEAE